MSKTKINQYMTEKVPVFIPRPDESTDSITVTLNGVNYQIQCARQVMVPRKIALIIEKSRRQEESAHRLITTLTGRS